ncbi:MAG: 6-carboxytetrahydropterin synthase QueD [Selenomonadaceae bacterium]|nr:6-carboxytetrahydropterin synthase QueD [Selenomonadaceae bacterium]
MFELEVKCTFDAAHRVEGYPGKCDRLHGHTWTVAAKVQGRELDELGLLVDFKLLNQALKDVAATLDHQCLNDLQAFAGKNPTAENIAQYVYRSMAAHEIFRQNSARSVRLAEVLVWESAHSAVRYFEEA